MPTFTPPTPLTQRIREAKHTLDQVRRDGHQPYIDAAERVLDVLVERVACRPLVAVDPKLDAHLRVTMK